LPGSALNEQGGGASLNWQADKIASPKILYTIKVNSILSGIYNFDTPDETQKSDCSPFCRAL